MAYLTLKNVSKTYHDGLYLYEALKNISLSFEKGEFVAITGASGCGKSTLLNLVATIHSPTSGEIILNDVNLNKLTNKQIALLRRNEIGILFQEYNLIENLTVRANLKMVLNDVDEEKLIDDYLAKVGLADRKKSLVSQLSGGQKQRIALARSLLNSPPLLLCDEPTGALDSINSEKMMELLRQFGKNSLVLCVSHDLELVKKYASRIITLDDGKVIADNIISTNAIKQIKKNEVSNHLAWPKIFGFGYKSIKERKGRFFVSLLATSVAMLFILLGLGVQKGAMNYIDDLFMSTCDAQVLDLANYQTIEGFKQEIPIDYQLLDELSDSRYDIRLNLNGFYNDYIAPNLTYSFHFYKRKVKDIEFKCASSYFDGQQMLAGRMPLRHFEVVVSQSFIEELKRLEGVEKPPQEYLKTKLGAKSTVPLNYIGTNYEFDFAFDLQIVGVVKDTIFTKGKYIYLSYPLVYQFLNESEVAPKLNLLKSLMIEKRQIDIKEQKQIIEVVNQLKNSKFYSQFETYSDYRFTFTYSSALDDYLTFADLVESLIIIIYAFGAMCLIISIILTSNTIYSIINEILHDLAILSVVGVKFSSITAFPLIFSIFINSATFLLSNAIGYGLTYGNPYLNQIFKTKNILYLDLYTTNSIIFTLVGITLLLILASIVFPLLKIKKMNLLEVLKQ